MIIKEPNVTYIGEANDSIIDSLDPDLQEWVVTNFAELNDLQKITIPRVVNNESTLVMSPTGSGKTLAAFLGILSELRKREINGLLEDRIYVLYVSPLKALNNDIMKNLEIPLNAMRKASATKISIAKRTGDTTAAERSKMLRKPPHILITTPESLALMQTAPKFKDNLYAIEWIIIDEIHALADNKRGSYLSLNIERLCYYLKTEPCRIGLSATIEPEIEIAKYLMGNNDNSIGIVNMKKLSDLEVQVISPTQNLVHAPFNLIERRHLEMINQYLDRYNTTLIFTNTRHMTERMRFNLVKNSDGKLEDKVSVHHGSLDKKVRLDVENKLKKGEMKAVFSSTSLELGIDIGSIDMTVQVGSPKTVRSFLQRVGRSGHSQDTQSQGRILVIDRDDLVESAAIGKLALEGVVDAINIPDKPMDVLFQALVGMALEKKWRVKDAFEVINKSYPYRNMDLDEFVEIMVHIANPTNDDKGWKYTHIWYDPETKEFGKRRSSRLAYMQNIGTIPETSMINVILEGYRSNIGQVSERFAESLTENDVFTLAGRTYGFIRSLGSKILVKESFGRSPTIPSWTGEAQTRSVEISKEISRMYMSLEQFLLDDDDKGALEWIIEKYPISEIEGRSIINYLIEQQAVSTIPSVNRLIVEKYVQPSGIISILVLSIYGRATNLALSQIIATRFANEMNIGTVATDNGFILNIPPGFDLDHHNLFDDINHIEMIKKLKNKIVNTELFKNRFRQAASRALMILKRLGTRRNNLDQQLRQSRWLIRQLDCTFPIIQETIREIMYDSYNLNQAISIFEGIKQEEIEVVTIPENAIPSPLTHQVLLSANLDIIQMDDKAILLQNLHQEILSRLLPDIKHLGKIFTSEKVEDYYQLKLRDPSMTDDSRIRRFCEFPIGLNLDNFDFYKSCNEYTGVDREVIEKKIASDEYIHVPSKNRYFTKDTIQFFAAVFPLSFWDQFDKELIKKYRNDDISPSYGLEFVISNLLRYSGPMTQVQISDGLGISHDRVGDALFTMQKKYTVLSGKYLTENKEYILPSDRDELVRTRLDLGGLTKENLSVYRLKKMRLVKKYQSHRITILDYLRENGPVRDPIELNSRLPNFVWKDLRKELLDKNVYFGRFLGRRLVFIHQEDLAMFISITRTSNHILEDREKEIFQLIKDVPGVTIKEIGKLTIFSRNEIQGLLNNLEQELYISRIGWELSLVHGGFANPQYITLPYTQVKDHKKSLERIILKLIQWYGPLTLRDILRITRIPYESIEYALQGLKGELVEQLINSYNYYGFEGDFDEIENITDESTDDNITFLSQLDPYFYMASGSMMRESLPRQSRLSIIRKGKVHGHIELRIPDRDILQILNIQIPKRSLNDIHFIRTVGNQLFALAKRVYLANAVFIEEINFNAANHVDNKIIVNSLREIGYRLKIDHLIGGTSFQGFVSEVSIFESKLLNKSNLQKVEYQDFDELISKIGMIDYHHAVRKSRNKDAQLIIANHIRNGKYINFENIIYHPNMWTTTTWKGDSHILIYQIFKENPNTAYTRSMLMKEAEISDYTLMAQLQVLLDNKVIEIISPFAKTIEYRLIPEYKLSRKEIITNLLRSIIENYGPMNYNEINIRMQQKIGISRSELLVVIANLLLEKLIYSTSVKSRGVIMYFSNRQKLLLSDKRRNENFLKFEIHENDELMIDIKLSVATHFLVHYGKLIALMKLKKVSDQIIVENIEFVVGEDQDTSPYEELIHEIIVFIENYFLDHGYHTLRIRKIQSFVPDYWLRDEITEK